jgi:hypothetical protein
LEDSEVHDDDCDNSLKTFCVETYQEPQFSSVTVKNSIRSQIL